MAIFSFALGAVLILCGMASLVVSLNLVPTDMGMLYAVCGAIAVSCGAITVAVAALTARVERLTPAAAAPRAEPAQRFEPADAPADSSANIVGRYTADGADYALFSDGAVEAEMEDGHFRFASMSDFKAYIANRSA